VTALGQFYDSFAQGPQRANADCEHQKGNPTMPKRPGPTARDLSLEETDLAVNFYDVANDYPKEGFVQIATRVMPRGRIKASAAFKREARRMFDLAR
jgi:hypothetical protein